MNYRWLASAALAIASSGFAAGVNGCSAAPNSASGDSTVESTHEPLTASTCSMPFTIAKPVTDIVRDLQNCHPVNGKMVCSGSGSTECVPVTGEQVPDPTGQSPLSSPTPTPTPIAPPSALAAIGCTWGIQLSVELSSSSTTANFWACPAGAQIPAHLSTAPACPPAGPFLPIGTLCEYDFTGTTIYDNSFLGAPLPGWQLVEEGVYPNPWNAQIDDGGDDDGGDGGGHIAHSCEGGCPNGLLNTPPGE
jgi:hypothetical protein